MTSQAVDLRLLVTAGRLLLEYNDSTHEIERTLQATARAVSPDRFSLAIGYKAVAVSLGESTPLTMRVNELRYNACLQTRVHTILSQVRRRELNSAEAIRQLELAEVDQKRHSRWLSIAALGLAAAALAELLGADLVAVVTSGISTALGLLVRQELGKRHFSLLVLPFAAAFIGAVFGAIAVRTGWTHAPGLAVIVPSLMIVPGPHLINGLVDLFDNDIPMGLARLGLASAILVASAIGVVVGMWLLDCDAEAAVSIPKTGHLNLLLDMSLAGVVTCGFAYFYNVGKSHIPLAIVGGALGHGIRYIALDSAWTLAAATLLGAFATGVVSALISRKYLVPFAVVAFAGAVTMMPGIQIYRAIQGCLRLARDQSDVEVAAGVVGDVSQAVLVVFALALGLIVAIRTVEWLWPSMKVD